MAIESLANGCFSEKSDIWSFGILLYEFFSLGKKPYTDDKCESLLQFLLDGNRLPRPEMATDPIYTLMKDCWLTDPCDRPTFAFLSSVNLDNYDYAKIYKISTLDTKL